jgi:radical SAM superfamily enzyme YgiQ (UPF0313 family)
MGEIAYVWTLCFVFGMDDDGEDVFRRTVDWAIHQGITTATFHIQTPYPGTQLHARMLREGRMLTRDWNLYDTRHVVYRPAQLRPEVLKAGYDWAYRESTGGDRSRAPRCIMARLNTRPNTFFMLQDGRNLKPFGIF